MLTAVLAGINFIRNLKPMGWLVVVLLALVVLAMGTCAVQGVRSHFDKNNAVKVNNDDRDLREELATKRQQTEASIAENERQLNDALDHMPDGAPSARRTARACLELRNDGHRQLPAECGPQTN